MKTSGASLVLALVLALSAQPALAATIVVDNDCELPAAITAANTDSNSHDTDCTAGSGADTIDLGNMADLYILSADLPSIVSDITILGTGREISGNDSHRIFHVQSGHLRLDRLSMINGEVVSNGSGGAILVNGGAALTVTNSYFAGNTAGGVGGAIASSGSLTVSNSSFDGNGAQGTGGGGFYISGGTATITHVTMFNNSASGVGGKGRALLVNGSAARVSLRNSILGDNDSSSNDCGLINNATLRQNVGNVIEAGDSGCSTAANRRTIGIQSSRGSPPAITISDTSHANGAGDAAICAAFPTDPTGIRRPATACDAGAAERDGFNDIHVDSGCTLSQAIQNANDNARTNSGCESGAVSTLASDVIQLTADVSLTSNTTSAGSTIIVEGNGKTVSVASGSTARPFHVGSGGDLTLRNITISGGSDSQGASVYTGGTLTMEDCVVRDGVAGDKGAGVFAWGSGTITIDRCAFINNRASNLGGAVQVDSGSPTVNISNSTFLANHGANGGGGIYIAAGTVTLGHLTLWNNTSGSAGAITGIHGGAAMYNSIIGRDSNQGGALCGSFSNGNEERGNIMWNGPVANNPCDVVTVANPNLGALTGSIPYLPLQAGSPAIGAGIDAQCANYATDQRGAARPATNCDVGAVQYIPAARAGPGVGGGETAAGACTGKLLNQAGYYRVSATYGLCSGVEFQVVDGSGVGIAWIVEAGFIDALDVWGRVQPTVEVCFPQAGSTLFLNAAASPRTVEPLASYRDGHRTCASIGKAGTVVLLPLETAHTTQTAAAPPGAMGDCMVTTNYILNLRQTPEGEVAALLPYQVTLTAFRKQGDWYYVDYLGTRGWVSAAYVTPIGSCG